MVSIFQSALDMAHSHNFTTLSLALQQPKQTISGAGSVSWLKNRVGLRDVSDFGRENGKTHSAEEPRGALLGKHGSSEHWWPKS